MLQNKEIETIVKDLLRKHTYLSEENGRFRGDIYVDHDDCMSKSQLAQISRADNKMECFEDELEEYVFDRIDTERDELMDTLRNKWDSEEHGDYDQYEDCIRDYVGEAVDFFFPYDHFLNQEILINILVDTGDGDHDYTLNNFASYNARENEEIQEESSILWLVQQQGYTKKQLEAAVREGEFMNSKFLTSLEIELRNLTSHMNALAFFVKMTLKEYIEMHEEKKSITLSADTSCGLYDNWNGAGGPLEVELEKEVTIPHKFVDAHIEGTVGYGVDEVYGIVSSFWKESVVGFLN